MKGVVEATMATQSTTQRKAAGQKAAATRRRKAAQRSRSARKAAETRARAEANAFQSLALRGQEIGERAVDLTVGAAVETRDRIAGATRKVTTTGGRDRLGRSLRGSLKSAQGRGTKVRREATRGVKRVRRDAERKARGVRRDAERRVKSLRS